MAKAKSEPKVEAKPKGKPPENKIITAGNAVAENKTTKGGSRHTEGTTNGETGIRK